MNRRILTLLVLALVAIASAIGTPGSSATYVSSSSNVSTVTAASDWTPPTVQLTSPGDPVSGTVTIAATAGDGESGIASVEIQYRATSATPWVTLCTDTIAPWSCTWNSRDTADGSYELRAVARDNAGLSTTSASVPTTVVNTAAVTLTSPGDLVAGNVTLKAALAGGSTVAWTVRVEHAAQGSTTWLPLCSGLSAPYTCSWATTATPDGPHDLRAVATAGNLTVVSPVVSGVLVDNTAPSITMADPGTPLRGSVTFSVTTADAHSGVATVVHQAATSASGPWLDLCSTTATPFSCTYDTTQLQSGPQFFRATSTDRAGNKTTSAVIGPRTVDNTTTGLRGVDVQAINGGSSGRIDSGDILVHTFSGLVDLTSITPGWNGSALPVRLEVRDVATATGELVVTRPGSTVNLGMVRIDAALIATTSSNAILDATLVASTETVAGVPRTVVTLQVGALVSGGVRTVGPSTTLIWTPSASATGIGGQACAVTTVVESGADDRDF